MPIRALKPMVEKKSYTTPQCCQRVDPLTHNEAWRRERYGKDPDWRHDLCQRPSTVQINGKHYCRLHGGAVALKMWLEGELVESSRAPPPSHEHMFPEHFDTPTAPNTLLEWYNARMAIFSCGGIPPREMWDSLANAEQALMGEARKFKANLEALGERERKG